LPGQIALWLRHRQLHLKHLHAGSGCPAGEGVRGVLRGRLLSPTPLPHTICSPSSPWVGHAV